jgi:galactitol-specific phosphotransferase system IIB component
MIKIQPVVREIVLGEVEALFALTNGYMNMSSYAYHIRPKVEMLTKKKVTIASLVVTLSRLRKEFKKEKPLIHNVNISNITTKLPLSEIVYENSTKFIQELESLHKNISVSQEDFFTTNMSTTEVDIICSSNLANKVLKHFKMKPKIINHNLAAVGISFDPEVFDTPNTFFSLLAVTARARINIEELVSTPTEFIFIVAEKDFGQTVALFSALRSETSVV